MSDKAENDVFPCCGHAKPHHELWCEGHPPAPAPNTAENDDLLALDLEYRLTIAARLDCECAPYFIRRREDLLPAVLRQAAERDTDPVDLFADYARKVHQRHEEGHRV